MALVSKLVSYSAGLSFLLLALLSPRSRKARYYLNTLLYLGSMGVCSALGILISIFMSLIPGQRLNINYVVARSFYYLAGTLTGIRFKVEGFEHIENNRPAVVIGNHQSSMDILYLGAMFPKHASIMAKKELRWAPLLGQWMWLSGAVFVNRASKKDAFKVFDYVGQRMRRDKLSLWIFPEGTRSKLPVPDLLPFKMGAFHLALQAKVPIVPVVCENYYRFYDSKSRYESGTIRIKILPPIDVSSYSKETVHDLADYVRGVMLKEIKALDAQADAYDTSSVVASTATRSTAANATPTSVRDGLGGVAKWMSYLVGTGSGHDVNKEVAKQKRALEQAGLGGGEGKPQDFGLVSEHAKASASASTSQLAAAAMDDSVLQKRRQGTTATTASGSSEEVDEDGNVLVKKPAA